MKEGYRHEYKYLISRASAELLKRRLPAVMKPDSHAGAEGKYVIRSLYFDDPQLSAYGEKISGLQDRAKYRIRYYGYAPEFLKLEKKEKHGNLTRKTACAVTKEEALRLQQGVPVEKEGLPQELSLTKRLRPVVLVDYDRTPFVHACGNTRITLDENLRTKPFCMDLLASHEAMLPVLDRDQVILEVKFDDYLPGHLAAMLEDIPREVIAISKYALCMDVSRLK